MDYTATKESLDATDKLKNRAIANFEAIDKDNAEEKRKIENNVKGCESELNKLK